MRRDKELAKDYACRHHVPKWYSHAENLVADSDVFISQLLLISTKNTLCWLRSIINQCT